MSKREVAQQIISTIDFVLDNQRRITDSDDGTYPATLVNLEQAADLRSQIEELTRVLVAEARIDNRSWGTIGAALGTTRQAAHERYHSVQARHLS